MNMEVIPWTPEYFQYFTTFINLPMFNNALQAVQTKFLACQSPDPY